jgi:hypothetical protein
MLVHEAGSAVEEHVRRLDRALSGPRRLKADLLREVRHGLADAAEAYEADGHADPERRAVEEFGPVREVAPAYQTELAAAASRTLGLRVAAIFALLTISADFMWRGAPWTGPQPPALYLFLSDTIDRLGVAAAVLGGLGVLVLWLAARTGRAVPARALRAIVLGIVTLVGLVWVFGTVVYAWSATMWDQALTWPPMIIGSAVVGLAGIWIGRAAWACLSATRRPAPVPSS